MNVLRAAILLMVVMFTATASVEASPTLKNGSVGQTVTVLQKKLQELGYRITEVDGVFGGETAKAVTAFQKDNKITATGIVNNATWRALRSAKSPANLNLPGEKMLLDTAKAKKVIATAKKYIGTPYAIGGTTPQAFDCSGYVQYVLRENGITVPRTADEQYDNLGKHAKSKRELVPGDLVFFDTDSSGISHVGFYLGDNKFIHASSSQGVRIDTFANGYWQPRYVGGNRIAHA